MAEKVNPTGTIRTNPGAPLPGLKASGSFEEKVLDGARPDELDDEDRNRIAAKVYREHEAKILAAIAASPEAQKPIVPKKFGIFEDSPQTFIVTCEMIRTPHGGLFRRGDKITYRELCQFDVNGDFQAGFTPDFEKPLIGQTKKRVDELIEMQFLRPSVYYGSFAGAGSN